MKRTVCALLSVLIIFTFAACGEKKPSGTASDSSNVVDEKTVSIVNDAFAATKKALEGVSSLGYKRDMVMTVSADGKDVSSRAAYECTFIKGDTLAIASQTVISNEKNDTEVYYYTDGTDIYGATADTTYLITRTDDATKYLEGLTGIHEFYDATAVAPVNTLIVDTSSNGYGFVLDYPTNQRPDDFDVFFGDSLKAYGDDIKPQSLKVSGIIDDKGRIETETVTYIFTYDYTAQAEDVDPDNESAQTTVTKTATVTASVQIDFNYGVTEVHPNDEISIPSEDGTVDSDSSDSDSDGDKYVPEKIKELSLTDFQLLAAQDSEDK